MKLESREMKDRLANITHEELVVMVQQGNDSAEEYLINQYKDLVKSIARSYFIVGAEAEDVEQEARIGLFKAIMDYDGNSNTCFRTYANLCMNRQIITAIKAANRKKHTPLNTSVSLDHKITENDEDGRHMTLADTLRSDIVTDAETLAIFNDIIRYITENEEGIFSELEILVWNEFVVGKSYDDIAKSLNKNQKSIYNAMDRIKKKIVKYMTD